MWVPQSLCTNKNGNDETCPAVTAEIRAQPQLHFSSMQANMSKMSVNHCLKTHVNFSLSALFQEKVDDEISVPENAKVSISVDPQGQKQSLSQIQLFIRSFTNVCFCKK